MRKSEWRTPAWRWEAGSRVQLRVWAGACRSWAVPGERREAGHAAVAAQRWGGDAQVAPIAPHAGSFRPACCARCPLLPAPCHPACSACTHQRRCAGLLQRTLRPSTTSPRSATRRATRTAAMTPTTSRQMRTTGTTPHAAARRGGACAACAAACLQRRRRHWPHTALLYVRPSLLQRPWPPPALPSRPAALQVARLGTMHARQPARTPGACYQRRTPGSGTADAPATPRCSCLGRAATLLAAAKAGAVCLPSCAGCLAGGLGSTPQPPPPLWASHTACMSTPVRAPDMQAPAPPVGSPAAGAVAASAVTWPARRPRAPPAATPACRLAWSTTATPAT
jgi:hypothetical protein